MEIRELNIQPGDAMDRERREYSQWVVELSPSRETKFAERILDYVQKS